jgi:hypothetical protein
MQVDGKQCYKVMVRRPEGNKQLAGPKRRWEHNIKMYLRYIRCGGAEWINLARDRNRWRVLLNTVMNVRVHKRPEIC